MTKISNSQGNLTQKLANMSTMLNKNHVMANLHSFILEKKT